jgi:hypothetical protein
MQIFLHHHPLLSPASASLPAPCTGFISRHRCKQLHTCAGHRLAQYEKNFIAGKFVLGTDAEEKLPFKKAKEVNTIGDAIDICVTLPTASKKFSNRLLSGPGWRQECENPTSSIQRLEE